MNAKTTMIKLQVGDKVREFEVSHAERLLKITRAGWKLPEGSKYEFIDNAIRVKQVKKENTGRAQRRKIDSGEIPSAED